MAMSLSSKRVVSRSIMHVHQLRRYATFNETPDLRALLMSEVKAAMKAKDTVTSTTLRSVLSEVYSADKASNEKVSSSTIANIVRKAVVRRTEAAAKFTEAARPELAHRELQESNILSKFLPPLLSATEIDFALREALATLPADPNPKSLLGRVFKEFYSKVDKSTVDANLVKQRADVLLAAK